MMTVLVVTLAFSSSECAVGCAVLREALGNKGEGAPSNLPYIG